MVNLVLYALKFVFIFFLYLFIFLLIRSVLKDTKLASNMNVQASPARLVLNFGKPNSKSFSLTDKAIIGRSETADIQVDDNYVSHNHARITRRGNTYVVQDLGSTNGTFIRGKRIKKEALNNGDELIIGKVPLKFLQ